MVWASLSPQATPLLAMPNALPTSAPPHPPRTVAQKRARTAAVLATWQRSQTPTQMPSSATPRRRMRLSLPTAAATTATPPTLTVRASTMPPTPAAGTAAATATAPDTKAVLRWTAEGVAMRSARACRRRRGHRTATWAATMARLTAQRRWSWRSRRARMAKAPTATTATRWTSLAAAGSRLRLRARKRCMPVVACRRHCPRRSRRCCQWRHRSR
mmetsp:Transcript_44893/g.134056  ORF Transcript_44893/g.134056 Transcript_44893/m.134056 type:complete len:215 (-) Transcript_44893:876-1520(-)